MARLDELIAQRAALEAEIQQEKVTAIAEIKATMLKYGITLSDLGASTPKKGRPPLPIRYQDGKGNTWTGRGARPRWLSEALAAGAALSDFTAT